MGQINKKDKYELVSITDRPWSYNEIEYWKNPEDKTVNAVINFNDKRSRLRAGVLIVKDDLVLLGEEEGQLDEFSIPGGGFEENETPIDVAKREAQEEVYINIQNPIDTEYDYCECHTEVMPWVKENVPEDNWWYNYYTCLIIAQYKDDYLGKVDAVDKDPVMNGTSRWYKISEVINKPTFKKEWKKALIDFGYYKENLTESYNGERELIGYHGSDNYFKKFRTDIKYGIPTLIWFAKDKYICKNYIDDGYVYTAKVNLKNYLDLTDCIIANLAFDENGQATADLKCLAEKLNIEEAVLTEIVKQICIEEAENGISFDEFYLFDLIKKPIFLSLLGDYDSVVCTDLDYQNNKVITFGVRNPNQIKILNTEVVKNISIEEDLKDDAKNYFGTVPDYYSNVGLYINTDGTILDGSGELLGNKNGRLYGQRAVDHREVSHIFNNSIDGTDAMIAYMNEGNIRWKPEAPGFELIKEPTEAQYKTLEKLIRKFRDNVYVDIDNYGGETVWSNEYETRDLTDIIPDIKKYFNETKRLTEDTRAQLTAKSKNVDPYKNTKFGKNRFERKRLSKVANQVKAYNTINMNEFFKQDTLTIGIPVTGETNSYTVTLQMEGIVTEIAKNMKSNQYKLEFRTILQSVTKVFNTANIKVKCTCDDFKFRYAHNLIINKNSVDGSDKDPGPGKTGITAGMKGQGCKHILLVLANQDWVMKVSSVINNYINWMAENNTKLFLKIIFPKLYGVSVDDAEEVGIIPEDTKLDTEKHIIDLINEYGRNRGKFKKGSNINTALGANKPKTKEEKKED